MSVADKLAYVTVQEYLQAEETAPIKHEYVDGRVFAMSGATSRHNIIAGDLFGVLLGFLVGTSCRPYIEAFKVHVQAANCFYYPDIMVACGGIEDDSVYTEKPVLIIEVLSPSTAVVDRREKLANYMKIPSLREYLIVHQRHKKLELYRRLDDKDWSVMHFGAGEQIVLESLPKGKLTISVDTIYKNVQDKGGTLELREEPTGYVLPHEEAVALDW